MDEHSLHVAVQTDVAQVLECYPRIYLACHTTHRRDPKSERVLSERQASILDHLDEREPMALKDLAEHLGVTPSTMCIAVARLVRGGWVERDEDPVDGRKVRLRLSRAGARMKAAQTVLDPERVNKVLGRLAPTERADALRGLALLARASGEEIAAYRAARERT
jgi:DNA-binding MarR family transcriptional regulator